MSEAQPTPAINIRIRARIRAPHAPPAPPAPLEPTAATTDAAAAAADADADATDEPYAIGYKRPPKHGQFKPGRSGNPKGRPRGSKNWSTIMAEAAGRRRTIGVGGKKVRMSGSEAVAEQMVINAIKGCAKARRDFLNEMRFDRQREAAAPNAETTEPEALCPNDEALLADFFNRARGGKVEDEGA